MIICNEKNTEKYRDCNILFSDDDPVGIFRYVDYPYIYDGYPIVVRTSGGLFMIAMNASPKHELDMRYGFDVLRIMDEGNSIPLEVFVDEIFSRSGSGTISVVRNPAGIRGCVRVVEFSGTSELPVYHFYYHVYYDEKTSSCGKHSIVNVRDGHVLIVVVSAEPMDI